MIINEKRLARALKSSGAVGFRLRTVGGRMDLLGPGWALRERSTAYVSYLQTGCVVLSDSEPALAVRLSRPDEPGPIWTWLESRNWFDTGDEHGCGGTEA